MDFASGALLVSVGVLKPMVLKGRWDVLIVGTGSLCLMCVFKVERLMKFVDSGIGGRCKGCIFDYTTFLYKVPE